MDCVDDITFYPVSLNEEAKMNIRLTRSLYRPDGIFGAMTDENDNQVAVTLEHSYNNVPKIPAGTYTCTRYDSPKFGREVFILNNVPRHDFVEIHFGNFNNDSDGCILLGRRVVQDPDDENILMVTSSKNTFNKFMDMQKNVESFQLTVEDKTT